MEIRGKNVLVTGAAKRIGRALALDFASRGANIAVHYHSSSREAEAATAEIAALGSRAIATGADLTCAEAIDAMMEEISARLGRLDVVIASAAVFRKTPFEAISERDWDFHLDANLKSTFLLARGAAPRMSDGGAIVTFGDWAAAHPYRNFIPYCVSKAGVVALTRALAQELAPRIRVNCVSPGTVLPPERVASQTIAKIEERTPLGRIGSPDDVIAAVRFLVEGTDFATGTNLIIDGGRSVADPGYG